MPDFKPLYRYSFYEAKRLDELEKWRESFAENERCRDFMDEMVRQNYDGMHITGEIPQKTVTEFGFDRTRWVLANHIQHYDYDGRFSQQNKAWASNIYIQRPEEWELHKDPYMHDHTNSLLLNSHAVLVDYLADRVQQMYADLNLYGHQHSIPDSSKTDYKGKILILRDTALKESYRTPENQLFYAGSGYGCSPTAIGRTVWGQFLIDGERACFDRGDFIGVADDRCLPDWAQEKLAEIQKPNAPDESEGQTMKGM